MPWEADLPVVLSLFLTFTHYLNECDPYHTTGSAESASESRVE